MNNDNKILIELIDNLQILIKEKDNNLKQQLRLLKQKDQTLIAINKLITQQTELIKLLEEHIYELANKIFAIKLETLRINYPQLLNEELFFNLEDFRINYINRRITIIDYSVRINLLLDRIINESL